MIAYSGNKMEAEWDFSLLEASARPPFVAPPAPERAVAHERHEAAVGVHFVEAPFAQTPDVQCAAAAAHQFAIEALLNLGMVPARRRVER